MAGWEKGFGLKGILVIKKIIGLGFCVSTFIRSFLRSAAVWSRCRLPSLSSLSLSLSPVFCFLGFGQNSHTLLISTAIVDHTPLYLSVTALWVSFISTVFSPDLLNLWVGFAFGISYFNVSLPLCLPKLG